MGGLFLGSSRRCGRLGRRGRLSFERWRWPGDGAVLDDRQATDGIVFHVHESLAVLGLAQLFDQAQQVGGVQRGRLLGQARSQVGIANDGHAMAYYGFIAHRQFTVAALLGRHVYDDAAGLHALDHLFGDQAWRRLAGDQGRGDDDVGILGLACVHLALRCLEALAHHLGVATTAGAVFFVVHLDELAAERLDLVGHFGTCVVGTHDGAQIGGRANGSQTGYTGTRDEHLGRRHLARSGDLTVEVAAKGVGRFNHGAVA